MKLIKHPKSKHIPIKAGTRFGNLTIISLEGFIKKREMAYEPVYKCQCDCGKVINLERVRFKYKNTRSCGCLRVKTVYNKYRNSLNITDDEFYKGQLYKRYISNSKRRNLTFSLDLELFSELISSKCTYCGREPYSFLRYKYKDRGLLYNGLDRVNNNLGYIKENVTPCCPQCNFLKGTMNQKEFIDLVHLIHNNVGSISTVT